MGDGVPMRVFVSYARVDTVFVDQLDKSLHDHGYDTWVDRNSTVGGDTWLRSIQSGIDGAQLVVVVLSPEAAKSHWVESEYAYALDQRKRIIPLVHRECTVPLALQRLNWIDFVPSYSVGIDKLIHSLTIIEAEEQRLLSEQRAEVEAALRAQAEQEARIRIATDAIMQEQVDALARQRIAEALEQRNREEAAAHAQLEFEHTEALQRAQEALQRAQEEAVALQRAQDEKHRAQEEAERRRLAAQETTKLKLFRASGGYGALCLLWGLGAIVVFYTHSWQLALPTIGLAGVACYLIRYRFTVPLYTMIGIAALSMATVFTLSLFMPSLQYDQVQTTHLWLFGDRSIWLGRQLNSAVGLGFCGGCVSWEDLVDELLTKAKHEPQSGSVRFLQIVGVAFFEGVSVWLCAAALASGFGMGFGFGVGWNLVLYLWLPTAIALGLGLRELSEALRFQPLRRRDRNAPLVETPQR